MTAKNRAKNGERPPGGIFTKALKAVMGVKPGIKNIRQALAGRLNAAAKVKNGLNAAVTAKITIQPAFLVFCGVFIAMGYGAGLLVLLVSVTLHELAHVLTARAFGIKVERWNITPFGQSARLRGLESAGFVRRYSVILAGPLASFLLFAAAWGIVPARFFSYTNLALCVFNLLPAYPMDGGRLLGIALGNRVGVLRANRFLTGLSRAVFGLVMAAGLVQVVLFPYNISLLCAGFYLYRTMGAEQASMTWEFYRQKLFTAKTRPGVMPVRFFSLERSSALSAAVYRLCWDYVCVFYITDNGEVAAQLTEGQIAAHVREKGFSGPVWGAVGTGE
ncbi:MAG: site-2 protease family protein [Defluviitaleaceae bacterium]|nr:site-2 protease family protein [Defluviitaleaceae bacterium]